MIGEQLNMSLLMKRLQKKTQKKTREGTWQPFIVELTITKTFVNTYRWTLQVEGRNDGFKD